MASQPARISKQIRVAVEGSKCQSEKWGRKEIRIEFAYSFASGFRSSLSNFKKSMGHLLNLLHGTALVNKSSLHDCPKLLQRKTCRTRKNGKFKRCIVAQLSLKGSAELAYHIKNSFNYKVYIQNGEDLKALPHIQTLRKFPKEELSAKVVMVRFDPNILFKQECDQNTPSVFNGLLTIKYLYEAGAKVILVSDWMINNSEFLLTESVSDFLSEILRIKVVPVQCISCNSLSKKEELKKADILLIENLSNNKAEVANCPRFAEILASGVDIFVNDSFSHSHKALASTVGVTRFCYACIAGFHFEESLSLLNNIAESSRQPYVAIIGGGHLYDKAAALHFLASRCQGLIFVGTISFQIMHALGVSAPSKLVEREVCNEALDIVRLARERNIQILYPKDFWCRNEHDQKHLKTFPAYGILDGWVPVDLGPASLDEIGSVLKNSKKIIWIGPVKFTLSSKYINGASKLAKMLDQLSLSNCDITVVGNMACQVVRQELSSLSSMNMVENASVVWEFLKGRKLPGVMALDRAYPFEINWNDTYSDPAQPLVVDIGSGNGRFLLEMARRRTDLNFLGLEINGKLVRRCLDSVNQFGIKNGYFITTNATSTFRSIVSTYPGHLVLVSIQCPNPDFNKPEHRWSMLQRSLIEAVADLLTSGGKVFLQSDVKAVALRMKEQFLRYSKGQLDLVHDQDGWLEENPFGVRSDWEQHVIERGAPMYRLLFSKSVANSEALFHMM